MQFLGLILIMVSIYNGIRALTLLFKILKDNPALYKKLSFEEQMNNFIAQPSRNPRFMKYVFICLISGFIGFALLIIGTSTNARYHVRHNYSAGYYTIK